MARIWPNGGTSSPPSPGNARPDQAFRSTAEYGIPHDLTEWHRGIDLVGFDWIRAADDGKVVFSGHNGTAGYEIKIRHTDLTSTRYLHMEFGSLKFITGDYVKQGDIIGKMGATGYVTGKHLHFECIDANGATRINPRKYINPDVVLSGGGATPFEPEAQDMYNNDPELRARLDQIVQFMADNFVGLTGKVAGEATDTRKMVAANFTGLTGKVAGEADQTRRHVDARINDLAGWTRDDAKAILSSIAGIKQDTAVDVNALAALLKDTLGEAVAKSLAAQLIK